MKRIIVICVLLLTTIAHADPSCKTYGLDYNGDHYAIRFSCETSGIGAVYASFNDFEYDALLYFFTGDMVYIPNLAYLEYLDWGLLHESGLVFVEAD